VQVEGIEIDLTLEFRICGEENLESSVEPEPVHDVRANSSTNVVLRLEYRHVERLCVEVSCSREPCEPCSDDCHVDARR
jgi:hypothetical protein